MRHVLDNGDTIYKIADFGGARLLHQGHYYNSIHGTEPYLHPAVFKFYLNIEVPEAGGFDAKTDLWSIGVTLYNIATSLTPFFSKDRSQMVKMFAELSQRIGVIAASLETKSDKIHYHTTLPATSQLSEGLKKLMVPILSGLFTVDLSRQLSFSEHYKQVKKVLDKQIINVFFVNRMKFLKIFVDPDDTIATFHKYIKDQTDVDKGSQVFFYNRTIYESFQSLPKTDLDTECIFLIDTRMHDVKAIADLYNDYRSLNVFKKSFLLKGPPAQDEDTHALRILMKKMYLYLRIMRERRVVYKFVALFMENYSLFVENERRVTAMKRNNLKSRVDCINRFISIFDKFPQEKVNFLEEKPIPTETNVISMKQYVMQHESYYNALLRELSALKVLYTALLPTASTERDQYYIEISKFLKCYDNICELLYKLDAIFGQVSEKFISWYSTSFISYLKIIRIAKSILIEKDNELQKQENSFFSNATSRNGKYARGFEKIKEIISVYKRGKANQLDTGKLIKESEVISSKFQHLLADLHI